MNAAETETKTVSAAHFLPVPKLPNDRWQPLEIVFWLLPVAAYFAFPGYLVLISQIMIVGLFAVSLDLILGYAGIVSLGHAAFFGWAPTRPACWRCTAGANR
jgi:branched-chain amino acid transport system permease protein